MEHELAYYLHKDVDFSGSERCYFTVKFERQALKTGIIGASVREYDLQA